VPSLVYLLVFFLLPLVNSIGLAFRSDDGAFTVRYFLQMVHDVQFANALKYTFLLVAIIVPLQLVTALFIALLVNTGFKGSRFFLYICTIPLGIADLAAGLIWLSIFAQHGYLNSALYGLGIIDKPIYFISYQNISFVFWAIVIAEHWRATAIVLVNLVAGLQMISKDYLEAAEVLGARPLQKLWHVILPLLKPAIQSALIIRTILALQMFAVAVAIGGNLVPVLAGQSYFWYSLYRSYHMAAAYAVLLMVLSIIITWFYMWFFKPKAEMVGK
jgi:multiple sugar transport system permease protein